jgi:hypothetical protein
LTIPTISLLATVIIGGTNIKYKNERMSNVKAEIASTRHGGKEAEG